MSVEIDGYKRRFARARRTSRSGQQSETSDPTVTGAAEDESRSEGGSVRSLAESDLILPVGSRHEPNAGVESR
ncbi:hypothetical protein BRC86_07075 [Halobacteriales archaeon QS_3_64_16]|nr:MAG: hypothetical protein BRC86_07075 [Halobacteriales archaeon QS_3_64_16]